MPPWQIEHFTADGHTVERFHHGDLLSSDGAEGSKATTVHLAARHTLQVPDKDLLPFDQCGCHLSSRLTSCGLLSPWRGAPLVNRTLRMNCHPLSDFH